MVSPGVKSTPGRACRCKWSRPDTTGRIWVAAFKEFGYLAPDSLGFLQHRSLLEYVPSQIRESAKSWSVALTSRAVYFQSSNALLRWSEKLRTMKIWRSEAGFSDLNVFDDALYIRKSGVGFMRMEGDSLRLLPGGEKFS